MGNFGKILCIIRFFCSSALPVLLVFVFLPRYGQESVSGYCFESECVARFFSKIEFRRRTFLREHLFRHVCRQHSGVLESGHHHGVFFSVLNKLRLSETLLWRFVLATPHCGCRLVWGYLHCVRVVPPGQQ